MMGLASCRPANDTFMSGFTRGTHPLTGIRGQRKKLCAGRLGGVYLDRGEPAKAVGFESIGDAEKFVADLPGDFAGFPPLRRRPVAGDPGFTVADDNAVHGADGGNFSGRAGEKDFVGDVEHLARNGLLADRIAQMAGDGYGAVPSDAGESRVAKLGGVNYAVAHHKDVFAGSLADEAVDVEGNAFDVAVDGGFHADRPSDRCMKWFRCTSCLGNSSR